jgi:hypothetical protein
MNSFARSYAAQSTVEAVLNTPWSASNSARGNQIIGMESSLSQRDSFGGSQRAA